MKKYFLIVMITGFNSCFWELPTGPDLEIESDRIIFSALSETAKEKMNGVYEVVEGYEILGKEVAGKWVKDKWCLYSNEDVVYSENIGGRNGDKILFTGYIRIVRSAGGHHLDMNILPGEGADSLDKSVIPINLIIRGKTDDNSIVLKRTRNLNLRDDCHILAHRGGGRNSERLGFSENSIEMIRHSEILGATGVEIDVKSTRDGIPILFHDNTFSPRTVQGSYLLGRVSNFTLKQIKSLGRLVNGEEIPTLEEALDSIIKHTSLKIIWLDIKDAAIMSSVTDIVIRADNKAKNNGKQIKFLMGISSQEMLDAFRNCGNSNHSLVSLLVEFDCKLISNDNNYIVWAPRWTNGYIEPCGSMDIYVWTVDLREHIKENLNNKNVNGILSDYPSLAAGMLYIQKP
jgi:glycerophosphoryl diester phosphodiesterase